MPSLPPLQQQEGQVQQHRGGGALDEVDDKRSRNTAASARFRAKKKLKEQTLEQANAMLSAKLQITERRLTEYEMEVKWLRQLLADRSGEKRLREIYEENQVPYNGSLLASVPAPASHQQLTTLMPSSTTSYQAILPHPNSKRQKT